MDKKEEQEKKIKISQGDKGFKRRNQNREIDE